MRLLSLPAATFSRFIDHDGWAIASHIALSALTALFPFLIIVTAMGGIFGSADLADEATRIVLEAWPREVAEPIAREVRSVLTGLRGDALTIGAILALYFASSGVEALRVGLNRAYQGYEWRSWWHTRLESIVYVVIAAIAILIFALFVIFTPLIWRAGMRWLPGLEPLGWALSFLRLGIATAAIVVALTIAHLYIAAGKRTLAEVAPGLVMTILLWIAGGLAFGYYLDSFAGAYVTTYAGLATAMIALVFLYALAAIFLLGAELNAAIAEGRSFPAR